MSETRVKVEELLRRAQALEEKVDKTLNKHQKNTNTGKKRADRNKLSLKKKRTVKYFEHKGNDKPDQTASAKLQKTDLFSSIQFSSSEEEHVEEQRKDASICDSPSNGLTGSSLSTAHLAVCHSPTKDFSTDFVPDSFPNQDEQIADESVEFSKNVSELVLNADTVMVRDSFSQRSSELVAGADLSSSMSVEAVTSKMPLENSAPPKDESSVICHSNEKKQDSCQDSNGVSTSQSPTANIEHSLLVLSSRLENVLNSGPKKSHKSLNQRNKTSDTTASTFNSSRYARSNCSLGIKTKKRTGKTTKKRLVTAISFSSEEDEVWNSASKKSSDDVRLKNGITQNDEKGLNLCDVSKTSSTSQLNPAAEEILSLTDRLNRILIAPDANRKAPTTEVKKPHRRRPKILKMPNLFSSDSDSSREPEHEEKAKANAGIKSPPQQTVRESSFKRNSESFKSPKKGSVSIQVSMSSVSEQENHSNGQVKSGQEDISDDSVRSITDKSLQCSLTPECVSSLEDMQEISCTEINLTSKSLQVSLGSENGSCTAGNEELTMSVNRSPNNGSKEECRAHTQQALCNISLQVSMLSPDTSAELPELHKETSNTSHDMSTVNKKDNSTTGDDNDSNSYGTVLYKTAIDNDTSDHLYQTTSEHEQNVSPICALFHKEICGKEIAVSTEEQINQAAVNSTDDQSNLHKLRLVSTKKHGTGAFSSNESENENCHARLCDSESSSDAIQPEYAQKSFGKRRRARRRYTPSRVSTKTIGPDQKYEDDDDDDDDDILVSRSHCESTDSSSEDQMESFFEKMKKPEKPKDKPDLAEFIVADDELSSEEEQDILFYIKTSQVLSLENSKKHKVPSTASSHRGQRSLSPDTPDLTEDDTDDKENTPSLRPVKPPSLTCRPILKRPILSHLGNIATPLREQTKQHLAAETVKKKSFLSSLSTDCNDCQRDLDTLKFVKNFKKHKEELTQRLFELYNKTVFCGKLPDDLPINWNTHMYKTAGYCTYKKNKNGNRTTKVELSVKVCDSAERVRDTLIHELCHAAVWLLHGKLDGHGPLWKHWAYKANLIYPELPVISRCHNYKIQTKYTYKCTKCGYQIGRHSKSLDTASKVCGYCMSPFELISNTKNRPQTPGPFAQFVKTNYGKVKKQGKLSQQEVMKKLAADFASKNKLGT